MVLFFSLSFIPIAVSFFSLSPCITFNFSPFSLHSFFSCLCNEYFQQLVFQDKYFISPPSALRRVICMTPSNVHCHLCADCSAVRNRSVRTRRDFDEGCEAITSPFPSQIHCSHTSGVSCRFWLSPQNCLSTCLDGDHVPVRLQIGTM